MTIRNEDTSKEELPDLSQFDFPDDYKPFSDDNLDMLP